MGAVRLLWTQGQFAQVMFVEFAVGVSGFVQREGVCDVDFERTGLNRTVELLELLGTWLEIVALDLAAGRRFWLRLHTVRILGMAETLSAFTAAYSA